MTYSVPPNEVGRLAAVRALNIVGTPPEIAFDEISELAAQISQCPVSYITFADDDRFWLKANLASHPTSTNVRAKSRFAQQQYAGQKW